ncbi:MAG TPA: hypothetical protein VFD55_02995 [Candidatus Angelobacter sp.]|nr:hypothetical protein [Candidatus Angelobacter sp.]
MSQNPGGESSISSDFHNSNSQPIYNELDEIYDTGVSEAPIYQRQAESAINPASKILYDISESIAEARKNHLNSNFFHHKTAENNFIKAVAKGLFNRDLSIRRTEPFTEDILKRQESAIGATLFGPRPSNEHIEFFNDNRESWFFYQCITDSMGASQSVTFHYEVRPEGILRVSNKADMKCEFIKGQEFNNFMVATDMYHKYVMSQIYDIDLSSDKKAA